TPTAPTGRQSQTRQSESGDGSYDAFFAHHHFSSINGSLVGFTESVWLNGNCPPPVKWAAAKRPMLGKTSRLNLGAGTENHTFR
ncbi:MAG TPA: hypothetical protein VE172_02905, partial [Stackebrandtia sp.]|uniref:hypothetical protein n=1 Tax=Stackebrandtia sp. TaxID=2023065 RepID=UPI002D661277